MNKLLTSKLASFSLMILCASFTAGALQAADTTPDRVVPSSAVIVPGTVKTQVNANVPVPTGAVPCVTVQQTDIRGVDSVNGGSVASNCIPPTDVRPILIAKPIAQPAASVKIVTP